MKADIKRFKMSISAIILCDDRYYPYSVRIDGELWPVGTDENNEFIYKNPYEELDK